MIIRYKNSSCDFADLMVGDAFVFYQVGEKFICMKMSGIGDEYCNNFYNAVNLATGEIYEIEPHQKVEKVNAKIVVE